MTVTEFDIWVCVDCYFAHHYGWREPHPGAFTIGPDFDLVNKCDTPPLSRIADTPFDLFDNTCSNHNGTDEVTCSECGHLGHEDGITEFTWSQCEGCGSRLGGSRYRLHVDMREATA